jgi:hypothetical protein
MISQRAPIRGFLCTVGLTPEILVEFQYNPTQISDKRAVNYATLNAPGLLLPARQYSQGGDRTLSFTVRLDAFYTHSEGFLDNESERQVRIALDDEGSLIPELNKYRAFLYPQNARWPDARASFVPIYATVSEFASPPTTRFGFGDRVIDCIVVDMGINETLFNARLAPLRADISITLVEIAPNGSAPTRPLGGA